MAKIPTCTTCGVELDHDRHRFVDDTRGAAGEPSKVTQQYCDEHCPRCSPTKKEP